ncbi:MAG: aspartate/glutamate racemase family protein [Armatimonadota bacterium]|nr:aspartate/glutamate racemase family protein [Armatimonadota bacterium]
MTGMTRRILWINPVGTPMWDQEIASLLQQEAMPGTYVEARSLPRGPHHLEYLSYDAQVVPDVLHTIRQAEREGFDAAVVGCFYDPGVREAREVAERIAVAFPCESCVMLAATLGDRFSVIVGREKWIPAMRENVWRYGMERRLASFRAVGLGVHDFQRDPPETERRLLASARAAVDQDGAEVIILGCTIEFGFFRSLQSQLGVPVLDATVTPFKVAELLAELKQRFGWLPSKVGGFESPPPHEVESWILPQYEAAAGRS